MQIVADILVVNEFVEPGDLSSAVHPSTWLRGESLSPIEVEYIQRLCRERSRSRVRHALVCKPFPTVFGAAGVYVFQEQKKGATHAQECIRRLCSQ